MKSSRILAVLMIAATLAACGSMSLELGPAALARPAQIDADKGQDLLAHPRGRRRSRPRRFYQTWWFWNIVGVAVIAAVAAGIAANIGGTDRLAQGPDGRFDPRSFPNR